MAKAAHAVCQQAINAGVYLRIAEFSFDGRRCRQEFDGRRCREEEDYFLLRAESFEVSLAGLDTIDQETVVGYRWWEADSLQAAGRRSSQRNCPGCCAS